MTATVIIPSFNGQQKISRLLDALKKQTCQDFQLVVVIDGSTDDTLAILRSHAFAFRDPIFFEQSNKGRSAAKNQGAKLATGEVLIFYDDDMEPSPTSVQTHLDFHNRFKGAIVSGNPVEEQHKSRTDIQNYKAALSKVWTSKYQPGLTKLHYTNLFFTAANCSIPGDIFASIKGFDERINDAEDYDLAYRAMQQGIDVYFDKDNTAVHHESITCITYIRRLREYTLAHHTLQTYYPVRDDQSGKKTTGVKRYLYRIFATAFWPKLIDKGFFVRILPERLRFQLYTIIIHSLAVENPAVPV